MTGTQAAAIFFAENPSVDEVVATTDGNVWLPAEISKAKFHATKAELDAPATIERDDVGMDDLIAVAELELAVTAALNDVRKGTAQETPAPEPVAAPTFEEARADLADALGADELTNLEDDYTVDDVVLDTIDAIIATWYRSPLSVAAWAAQNQATREAAVAAAFSDFITLD